MIGVAIRVQGTTIGTVTDIDGNFTLPNVPTDATLEISYVGMTSQRIAVNGRTIINITLTEDVEALEEVVVIGYGVQRRANLTGSVATINLESLENKSRPVTNVSQVLNNAIPGLQVMQSSGQPNSDSFGINIRGLGTLNNSFPLILVDGMEQSLSMVNPSDIASVTVLKDAASSAIYGNRAANGVILITTKTGSEDINITYDVTFSYNEPFKIIRTLGGGWEGNGGDGWLRILEFLPDGKTIKVRTYSPLFGISPSTKHLAHREAPYDQFEIVFD